jgi:hypothetical protein
MRIKTALLGVVVSLLLLPAVCGAQSFSLLFGGEVDTKSQSYLYTGIVVEVPAGQNMSFMGRVWFDHLTYKFEKDVDTIRAKAPAFQPAVGLKFFGSGWSSTFWAGWEHRNTNIKPFREDVEVRGASDSLVVQVELDRWTAAKTNFGLIASYSTDTRYIWARGRIKQELSSYPLGQDLPLRIGIDIIGQGNKDYSAFQIGPLFEVFSIARNASVLIKGGYKNSSVDDSFYGGIEFYFGF